MQKNWLLMFAGLLFTQLLTAQAYRIDNNMVVTAQTVSFKAGTAELTPESDAALQAIKNYLDEKTSISKLRVEAHTSNLLDAAAAQELAAKRAVAVCQRLIKMGADCQRLLPVSFGSTKPVQDNSTAVGKAANERISFVNAALRERPIGGLPLDGGGKVVENPCY